MSFFPKEHLPLCAETTDDPTPPPCCDPLKGKDESLACWCSGTQCGAHTEQVLKSVLTRVSRHEQEGIDLAARAPLVAQPGPPAAPISLDLGWAMKLRHLAPWKKSYDKPRQRIQKQRHYFAHKGPYSQNYGFSSSHVWM